MGNTLVGYKQGVWLLLDLRRFKAIQPDSEEKDNMLMSVMKIVRNYNIKKTILIIQYSNSFFIVYIS